MQGVSAALHNQGSWKKHREIQATKIWNRETFPVKLVLFSSVNIPVKSVQIMLPMTRTKDQKKPFVAFCTNHTKAGYGGGGKHSALLLAVQPKPSLIQDFPQETGKWKIILYSIALRKTSEASLHRKVIMK